MMSYILLMIQNII